MSKKSLLLILGIPLIGASIALGLLSLPADDNQPTSTLSPDTADFEKNFYDYLAQSLQEIFISSGNDSDSKQLTLKVNRLTSEGISMIDEFIAQQKQENRPLGDADYNRLNQLRYYVYSSIAIDEEKSRESLNEIPNSPNKLALLYTYIETFTKEDSRKISQAAFQKYLEEQQSWAQSWEPNYLNQIETLQFKSDPIGKALPNHLAKYNDLSGKSLDLNLYRGKYLLLDFWATWCLPCIAELPYLQEAYQNYNPKGFEIISVSLDNNEEAFRDFISDRNITWAQYYDGKGFRSELVSAYGVSGIPTLYLIDPKGNTISANMRGEELIQILKSRLQ